LACLLTFPTAEYVGTLGYMPPPAYLNTVQADILALCLTIICSRSEMFTYYIDTNIKDRRSDPRIHYLVGFDEVKDELGLPPKAIERIRNALYCESANAVTLQDLLDSFTLRLSTVHRLPSIPDN